MDLNKIMNKINEGKYFSVADFLRDIHIIRYNTEFYHGINEDLTIRVCFHPKRILSVWLA